MDNNYINKAKQLVCDTYNAQNPPDWPLILVHGDLTVLSSEANDDVWTVLIDTDIPDAKLYQVHHYSFTEEAYVDTYKRESTKTYPDFVPAKVVLAEPPANDSVITSTINLEETPNG